MMKKNRGNRGSRQDSWNDVESTGRFGEDSEVEHHADTVKPPSPKRACRDFKVNIWIGSNWEVWEGSSDLHG